MDNNSTQNIEFYPQTPFDEIALAISGGGFRAAAYGLGTMMYLNHLQFNGKSLLHRTKFMASASGGTIAVVYYMLSLHKEESFEKFVENLLDFMNGEKLVNQAQHLLQDDNAWKDGLKNRNLINAFSKVYDKELGEAEWKIIWDLSTKSHVNEVCINATEFQSGLSFRFQNAEVGTANDIGNRLVKIKPINEIKKLRLSDLLAASSCFPLGFEPMIFPDDFVSNKADIEKIEAITTFIGPNMQPIKDGNPRKFALMDGGIVDNQAVESMALAFDRRDKPEVSGLKPFDLMIVADVSNRIIQPFKIADNKITNKKSIKFYRNIGRSIIWIGLLLSILTSLAVSSKDYKIVGLLFIIPSMITLLIGWWYRSKEKAIKKIFYDNVLGNNLPKDAINRIINYLLNLQLSELTSLLQMRLNSISTMVGEIFLKRIRRLIFDNFFEEKKYRFRIVSNFIYTLSTAYQKNADNTKKTDVEKDETIDRERPTEKMEKIAENARTTETTLWFTDDDKQSNRLNDIIATAQFTLCNSLIKYFKDLEDQKDYYQSLKDKEALEMLKSQLLTDWESFKKDPYFLI